MKTRDAGHCFEALDKLCQSPADQLKKSTIEARDTRCRATRCGSRGNYYEEIGYAIEGRMLPQPCEMIRAFAPASLTKKLGKPYVMHLSLMRM